VGVSHLAEELDARKSLDGLPEADQLHLSVDMRTGRTAPGTAVAGAHGAPQEQLSVPVLTFSAHEPVQPQRLADSAGVGEAKVAVIFNVEHEREDDGRWLAEVVELPGVLACSYDKTRRSRVPRRWPRVSSPIGLSAAKSVPSTGTSPSKTHEPRTRMSRAAV